ncbi:glycosyltransferase family 4 protein [Tumidithrix elongata RA019]|uniref:Glycosyltransferase family 4 protein n=1 Tax=Tumidithrix elongata BACA0141 TaxID=2716417 RepID=A0AAW9PYQ9_9CYAN|nr:glycosyltransferase family 4 protein [Tumidithrix elongata RA019]
MKIGYLHLGPFEHGINRYGRLLAAESQQRSSLDVLEAEIVLTDNPIYNQEVLIKAAQRLSDSDLVHIQFSYFNDRLWGSGWDQLVHLRVFLNACPCPIVATLHDVYYVPTGVKGILKYMVPQLFSAFGIKTFGSDPSPEEASSISTLRKAVRVVKSWWIHNFGAATATLRELTKHAHLILVCSQEEAQRLDSHVDPKKLKIIPHFVETRSLSTTPVEARNSLNLVKKRVITILGFIFRPKGYQLVVEALPYLPDDIQVVFAGNADADREFVDFLHKLAQEKGVDHRIRVTGYLSEIELESYLLATDLAICAFIAFSASGSISTWISVGCPILAFDLPQISEYNLIEPDAIQVFKPYTPIALAAAIQEFLKRDRETLSIKVARLGQKLSLPNIIDRHLTLYTSINQHSHPNPN